MFKADGTGGQTHRREILLNARPKR